MEFWIWVKANGFDFISSIGVIASLLFSGVGFHSEAKTRRIANLLALTENQRELWSDFYKQPELHRVLEKNVDLVTAPVRKDEEIFVILVIHHLNSAFQAIQSDLVRSPEKLNEDVASLLALPIPNAVWATVEPYLDRRFVKFVDRARSGRDLHQGILRKTVKLVLARAWLW
jgi:hypothetical protein